MFILILILFFISGFFIFFEFIVLCFLTTFILSNFCSVKAFLEIVISSLDSRIFEILELYLWLIMLGVILYVFK